MNSEGKAVMSDSHIYPARIERDEDGRYVVTFSDFGWGATDGARLEEALAEAQDLLRELIAATIREGRDLPKPSKVRADQYPIVPPLPIALKAALYLAFKEQGVSQRQFARNLNIAEGEVRRMLNPDHGTKAAAIDSVLRSLGKLCSVSVQEAA